MISSKNEANREDGLSANVGANHLELVQDALLSTSTNKQHSQMRQYSSGCFFAGMDRNAAAT